MQERLYNAIGLCMKAGKCQSGAIAAEKAIRSQRAKLVLLESSASEATKQQYRVMCEGRKIPFHIVETVGRAIGKDSRIVMAVTDEAFCKMILGAMPKTEETAGEAIWQ